MDEQDIAAIEQVFATVTNTLRTGSRGGAWRYDTTQFEEAGSALLAEVRRLRAGLQYIADADCDGRFCLCGGVAYDVLAGKPLPD